jgi:hypothetical protein
VRRALVRPLPQPVKLKRGTGHFRPEPEIAGKTPIQPLFRVAVSIGAHAQDGLRRLPRQVDGLRNDKKLFRLARTEQEQIGDASQDFRTLPSGEKRRASRRNVLRAEGSSWHEESHLHRSQHLGDRRFDRGRKPGARCIHNGAGNGNRRAAMHGRLAKENKDRRSVQLI